jgi:hypothetical protein
MSLKKTMRPIDGSIASESCKDEAKDSLFAFSVEAQLSACVSSRECDYE